MSDDGERDGDNESIDSAHSSVHANTSGIGRRVSVTLPNDSSLSLRSMSKEQLFTVITFCFANFCVGAFYSLLAPFFPQEVNLICYNTLKFTCVIWILKIYTINLVRTHLPDFVTCTNTN